MKHILCFGWLMMVRYGGVDTRRADSPPSHESGRIFDAGEREACGFQAPGW